jgi:predicted permease
VSRIRALLSRIRALGRARRAGDELKQEIASHLEEAIDEYRRQGMEPDEARRAALLSFGGVARIEEAYRDVRSFGWVDQLRRDVRDAARSIRRSPGFAAVVVLVLAAGVAATSAGLTLLNAVVFRPLPFADPDQLVAIRHAAPAIDDGEVGISRGLYFHYRQHAGSLESLALFNETVSNLQMPEGGAERVHVTRAGMALFETLRVTPLHGRLFTADDAAPGFMNLRWTVPVLLAHDLWLERFGGSPDVIGRVLSINESPRRVIGVLPAGFRFPRPETQIWMLFEPPQTTNLVSDFDWQAIARLRPGVSAAAAQTELTRLVPPDVGIAPIARPLKSHVIGDVAGVLWPLFGGMALLLLIAGLNAGGMFLVRSEDRRREMAVREALGASLPQIGRLFLIEALMLTTAAAAAGLFAATGLVAATLALLPDVPRAPEVAVDRVALAAAGSVSVILSVVFAALSARRLRRTSPASALGSGFRATGAPAARRRRNVLVSLQVAIALVLLAGSALMAATYRNLSRVELGFDPANLLTAEVGLPSRRAARHARLFQDLVDHLRRLPGVADVSAASFVPLAGASHRYPVQPDSTPLPFKFFVPGFFQAMDIPVVRGDDWRPGERPAVPYPVLISASLARRLYPGTSAVGQPIRRLDGDGNVVEMYRPAEQDFVPVPAFTIAGVVADVRETGLRSGPDEIVYVPAVDPPVEQSVVPVNMTIVVRAQVTPSALAEPLRTSIIAFDPSLSISRVRTMDEVVRTARANETFVGALLMAASIVSAFLAAVGIYGTVRQVGRGRTREIGVRIALGARRSEVTTLIARDVLRAAALGVLIGVAAAVPASRTLESLVFGVGAHDPRILLAVAGSLLATALAAAFLAAARAARVDPLDALRSE